MMSFISNGFEIIKFAIMYEMGLQLERKKGKKQYLLLTICFLVFTIIMEALPENINPIGIYGLLMILETVIMYNEKMLTKIMVSFWTMGAIGAVDGSIYISLKIMLNSEQKFYEETAELLTCMITIVFLIVLFQGFGKKKKYPLKYVRKRYLVYMLGIGIINEMAIALLLSNIAAMSNESESKGKFMLIALLGVSGLFFQLAFITQLAVANQAFREKEEIIRKTLKMQEENYKYLKKKEEETHKFRHDIKKHLYLTVKLGSGGKYKEQQDYLKTILGEVEIHKNYVTVHNGIVDAILNRYMEICKEEGIIFQVKGAMPPHCYVEAYDLCTIFANLLENAVEASKETEEKQISLTIGFEEDMIFIQQKNVFKGILHMENGQIKTTKQGKEHGYGLKNIEESIKRYNGTMNYRIEEQSFLMEIMLYNEQVKERKKR